MEGPFGGENFKGKWNIKTDLEEVVCEGVDSINFAQGRKR
jgi:hypothetical protein